jgi:two-component system, chemotaxis family, sensor kinase CheA
MSDDEIVKEFLVESYENLDRLDLDLIALEKKPGDRETLASIFRTIHTIKGTSGFLAFNQLEAVTHVGENLLAKLRDGVLSVRPEITTALLTMVDSVRQMLANIESSGNEGERDDAQLIAHLTALLGAPAEPGGGVEPAVEGPPPDPAPALAADKPATEAENIHQTVAPPAGPAAAAQPDSRVEKDDPSETSDAQKTPQRGHSVSDSTIRVDVGQLDRLMNGMGELVLLRNQIMQHTNSSEDRELVGTSQRLNLLTTELQEGVMKTRMQPIGNVWSKFPRIVRDMALACGKQVGIEMEGKETELDKTIIEAIKDPLTHLVRNAVDHGVEAPEIRRSAGKNREGLVRLRAFHEGGQVNIEMSDDGAGLNLEKVRNKALQKGLITADQSSRMTEREVANLIFLPGLSTAEKVSNVSGRGVGMDVVKTNIEKIGGTVDVQSKPGQGTTIRMKIPLTLAIIPALIVTSAGDRYAIPQVSLLELVRLEGEQLHKGIEQVNGAPVHRLRGRLLPLVYLNRELKTEGATQDAGPAAKPSEAQNVNIVVLRADDRQFGLVVDEINDTEEIVVKPLSKQLKTINTYAGATIMGDGKVALILDVMGLAQRANVVGEGRELAADKAASAALGAEQRSNAVLLFQNGESGRMAIDLALVARLEEFPGDAVERAADREVVQYRGQIMPLVRVSDVLENRTLRPPEKCQEALHVVVYSEKGRSVGLVVDRILDIVEESFVIEGRGGREGVTGSAVIQKRVTDILDVPGLIAAAEGRLPATAPA